MNKGENINQTNFDKIPEINYSDVPEEFNQNSIKNKQNNNDIINEENQLMKELSYQPKTENLNNNSIKNLTTIEETSKENNITKEEKKENEELYNKDYSLIESIIPINREENEDLMSFYGQNYDIENMVKNFDGIGQEFSILEEDYLEVLKIGEVDDETFRNITHSEKDILKKAKEVVENMEYEGKNISLISGMDYLLMKAQNVNEKNRQSIQKSLEQKNDKIYAWREILPGNDSFYRSIMFTFLEGIILSRNKNMFRIFLYMLDDNIKNSYFRKILSFYQIDPSRGKLYIILIYSILISGENNSTEKAHSFLIKIYNSETSFDPLLILNLKFSIYKYLKANEKRIYTQEYNKKMGELLPQGYKNGYRFKDFYENNLLQLGKKIENISILVVPFILRRDLFIYNFTENDINHFWVHTEGRENQNFLPIRLINLNNSYSIIYEKNYFMQFKNILNKFSNINNNLINDKNDINKNNYIGNILDNIDEIDEKKLIDSKIPINQLSNFLKKDNVNNDNNTKQNNNINIQNINAQMNINNNNNGNNNNYYITNMNYNNNNINMNNYTNNNYLNNNQKNIKENINKNTINFQNSDVNKNNILNQNNNNFDNNNDYSKKVNNLMNYNNNYTKNNNEFNNYNNNIYNTYINTNKNNNNNINYNINNMNNNYNNNINKDIKNNINYNNLNNNYNKYNQNQGNDNYNFMRQKSQEKNNNQNNNNAFPKEMNLRNQNIQITKTFNKNNYNKINNNNWQCFECKNGFYCENCTLKILIINIKNGYIKFISENKINLINEKPKKNFSEFLSNLIIFFPNQEKKTFSETYYLLTDMNKNIFNSQLNIIKSSICLGCFKYIKDETNYIQNNRGISIKNTFLFKLPCGCIFCSQKCLSDFLEQIPIMKISSYICVCGEEYNCIKLKYLLYFSISHNLTAFKNEILRIRFEYMKNKCCICNKEVPLIQGKKNDFNIFEIMDQEIEQIFKINKFNHLVCNKCAKNKDISKKNIFYCKMCSSEHSILSKKSIQNGQIRTNCSIF